MNMPWARPLILEPLPLRPTICGLLLPLSLIFRVAAPDPPFDGVKVTCTVQLDPAATLPPHLLLLIAKAPAPVPPIVICETPRGALPLSVMVKVSEPEVPTRWAPKSRLAVEGVT